MDLRKNAFKHAIAGGKHQTGLWCTLPSGYTAEALGGCGFDWLLFDTEHSPGDPITVMSQLQAVSACPVSPIVRPASNDTVLIKRMLDAGAQTLLAPYVQNREEAAAAVAAVRYPPRGVRGVAATTRASGYGAITGYAARAEEEICLLVQVETVEALAEIEAIAELDGIDGIFVGPGDLSASMGYPGQPGHPEVKAMVLDAIRRIAAAGKPAGLLTLDKEFARECIEAGSLFTAIDLDASILLRNARDIARTFSAQ